MPKRRTPLTTSSRPACNWLPKAEVYVLITTPPPGKRIARACTGAKVGSSVLETRSKRQVTTDDTTERPQKRSKLSASAPVLPREKSGFPAGITPLTALRMETRAKALERPKAISEGSPESKETTPNVDSGTEPNKPRTPLAADANGSPRPTISPGSSALKIKLRFPPRTPPTTGFSAPSTSPEAGNQGLARTSSRVRLIVRPPVSSASSESAEPEKRESSVSSAGLSDEEVSTPNNLPVGLPKVAVSTHEAVKYAPGLGKSIGVLRPAFEFASYAGSSSDDESDVDSGIMICGDNGMEAREREREKYATCTTWLAPAISGECIKCTKAKANDASVASSVSPTGDTSLPLAVSTNIATMDGVCYQPPSTPPRHVSRSPSPFSPIPDLGEFVYPSWEFPCPDASAAEAYISELHAHGLYVPFPDECKGPQYRCGATEDPIREVATSLLAVGPGE